MVQALDIQEPSGKGQHVSSGAVVAGDGNMDARPPLQEQDIIPGLVPLGVTHQGTGQEGSSTSRRFTAD